MFSNFVSAVSVCRRHQQKHNADPKQRPRQLTQDFPRHKTHRRSFRAGEDPRMNPRTEISWTNPGNFRERLNSRPKLSRAASAIPKRYYVSLVTFHQGRIPPRSGKAARKLGEPCVERLQQARHILGTSMPTKRKRMRLARGQDRKP